MAVFFLLDGRDPGQPAFSTNTVPVRASESHPLSVD